MFGCFNTKMNIKSNLIEYTQTNQRRGQLTQAVFGQDFVAGLEVQAAQWRVIPSSKIAKLQTKIVAGLPATLSREENLETHLNRLLNSEVCIEQSASANISGILLHLEHELLWIRTETSTVAVGLHCIESLVLWKTLQDA